MIAARDFTAADWERTERNWTAWWRGDIERPMIVLEARTILAGPTFRPAECKSLKDWSRRSGLNRGPADYESAALPLSYAGIRRGLFNQTSLYLSFF